MTQNETLPGIVKKNRTSLPEKPSKPPVETACTIFLESAVGRRFVGRMAQLDAEKRHTLREIRLVLDRVNNKAMLDADARHFARSILKSLVTVLASSKDE